MSSTQLDTLYWDPLQHSLNERPYEIYRRLRNEQPVYFNDRYGFYVLSRFDDVYKARLDWKVFSNTHSVQFERLMDPTIPLNFMNDSDPPEHTAVRTVVQREFTPRKAAELETRVKELCRRLLDEAMRRDDFDFVRDFAEPFPFLAICQLLGVDDEYHAQLWQWWEEREALIVAERTTPDLSGSNAVEERIRDFLYEIALARRDAPREDMMTYLIQTRVEDGDGGERELTRREIGEYCRAFFVAGSATTTQLLGWSAILLAANPDQRQHLVDHPDVIPNAIEEILRLEPPAPSGGRWLMSPVELHGTVMPQDSIVMLYTAAASRDERVYDRPDEMDVTRKVRQLAFGHGVHLCLGASLARLEGKVALELLLESAPEFRVDEANSHMRISSGLRGWKSIPMSVR